MADKVGISGSRHHAIGNAMSSGASEDAHRYFLYANIVEVE